MHYSMKAVTRLTGLSPDTLRAWERRYGAVVPSRDPNGRRLYSADDVVRLQALSRAAKAGHTIGSVAPLSNEEIRALLEPVPGMHQDARSDLTQRLMEAAEHCHWERCAQILDLTVTGLSPMQIARDVIAPTLREVGKRWQHKEFCIAQEHLLSCSIRRTVEALIGIYQKQANGPTVVLATLSGERHEFGILLACLVAASRGFRSHYLGADLPAEEVLRACRWVRPVAVIISLVQTPLSATNREELAHVSLGLEQGCQLWVGGEGAGDLQAEPLPAECLLLGDFDDLNDRLQLVAQSASGTGP